MALSPEDRKRRARIAAHAQWAQEKNRSARTAKARAAADDRFYRLVDPDGVMTPEDREKAAANARQAHFKRMGYNSAKKRRRGPVESTEDDQSEGILDGAA